MFLYLNAPISRRLPSSNSDEPPLSLSELLSNDGSRVSQVALRDFQLGAQLAQPAQTEKLKHSRPKRYKHVKMVIKAGRG